MQTRNRIEREKKEKSNVVRNNDIIMKDHKHPIKLKLVLHTQTLRVAPSYIPMQLKT